MADTDIHDLVEEKDSPPSQEEAPTVERLFDLIDDKNNPWRSQWLDDVVVKCYKYKELDQWSEADKTRLAYYAVPPIAADRINRGRDTIIGIRTNTNIKKKIVKRELGDEVVAGFLDKVADYVSYNSDFEATSSECFESMIDVGRGVREVGWDQNLAGGLGDLYDDFIPIENFWSSPCRKKDLSDARWACKKVMMEWESAVTLAPEFAGEIKALRQNMESEWELIKGGKSSTATGKDYYAAPGTEKNMSYPDMVAVYGFWLKHTVPVSKVMSLGVGQDGQLAPQMRVEPFEYEAQEGEQKITATIDEWWQYVVIGEEKNAKLVKASKSEFPFHPFVAYTSETKKSGQPFGYIEHVIPHQDRINIALAQKLAYNNKSIKSPLVAHGMTPQDIEKATMQTEFGAILSLGPTAKIDALNTIPTVNLQAVEEGNMARLDMDFAAAATEEPLRGGSQAGASGIKLSLQQSAAVTPLNKYVKAEQYSLVSFYRKVLYIVLKKYSPERMFRIVGNQAAMQALMTQTVPIQLDALDYDVVIEEQAISDFNKQQSFNAALALHQSGFIMDGEYMIRNAPIKNVEDALASHERAKQDVIRQLVAMVEQLQQENQFLAKNAKPEAKGNPKAQGSKGKSQNQGGQRSMVGGTGTTNPFTSQQR